MYYMGERMVKKKLVEEYEEQPQEQILDLNEVIEEPKPLIELLDHTFVITDVEFSETTKGTRAVITLANDDRYFTFSQVVISQLKALEPKLKAGIKVRAKLVKSGRALRLANPK